MNAKNPRPDEPDERLLEEITGRKPPRDSFAPAPAPSQPRGASRTSALRGMGTAMQGGRPGAARPDDMGMVDFIFHHINDWVDLLLEQLAPQPGQGQDHGQGQAQRPGPTFMPVPPAAAQAAPRPRIERHQPTQAPPDEVLVTRQTGLTGLPLPAGLVYEPDLKRYFDQMRLYDYRSTRGGLAGLTLREVANFLMRGRWGEQFPIRFSLLGVKGPWAQERAYERYMGMLPVYKAQANSFPNDRALQKAIEDDVMGFLRTGQGSVVFHGFQY